MRCTASQTPEDIDLPSLREKYHQERARRMHPEGDKQYLRTAEDASEFAATDTHSAPVLRAPISADLEVAVLGGGFAGLLAGARLKEAGVRDVRIIGPGETLETYGTGTAIPVFSVMSNPTAICRSLRK